MPPKIELDFRSARSPRAPRRRDEGKGAVGVLVVGDFSGRGGAFAPPASNCRDGPLPVPIDLDTFDQVLLRHAPRLSLPLGEPVNATIEMSFTRLEDFHPDSLLERVDLFSTLPAIALAAVRQPAPEAAPDAGSPAESDSATLARLLGGTEPGGRPALDIGPLLRRIVAPHVVPAPGPRQEVERRIVQEAVSAVLRFVLHHPDFQALETAWRSMHRLVTRLEDGAGFRIGVLDMSRTQIEADLVAAGGDPSRSRFLALLDGSASGDFDGGPWALIVVDFIFGPAAQDLALLAALGAKAERLNATLLAGADPLILGCRSLAGSPDPATWKLEDPEATRRWSGLRRQSFARSIGLAIPRVLLRSDPVERIDFDEMDADPAHEHYLWGNGGWAVAEVIMRALSEEDQATAPEDNLLLEDLPACVEESPVGRHLKPCAEALLGEAAADAILARGLMPILSHRDRGVAHLLRLQSIADPPAPLRGAWTGLVRR